MTPPTLHATLRALLARTFLPTMLTASVCAYAFAPLAGLPAESAVMAVGIVTLLVALLLDRLMPYHAEWNLARGDTATDWLSFAVMAAAAEPLVKATMALAVVAVYGHRAGAGAWFASALPLAAQIVIATLLIELAKYAAHRWHHSNVRTEGDSNFGNALLLGDHVFSTYRPVLHKAHAPTHIGLYAPSHYPTRAGYVRQLLSMFTPACCKAGAV